MPRAVDSTARAMAGEALSRLDNGSSGSGGTTVDAYSKLETDNLLNAKVDDVEFAPIKTLAESNEVNITYLAENKAEKTEVDTLSELVAEIDDELDLKANKADVYTKAETDTAVSNKVAEIIANAPEDFDTLKEMSDWIDSHEESASAMNTAIKQNTSDIANLKSTDESTATEIASVKSDVAINRTTLGVQRKNLLKLYYPAGHSYTNSTGSVTWQFNSDYSVSMTVNSTITNGVAYEYGKVTLDEGIYILTVTGYTTPNITHTQLYAINSDGVEEWIRNLSSIENEITVSKKTTYVLKAYRNNTIAVGSKETFYPMLRYADISDDTYEPYKPSLQEQVTALTARIEALETALASQEA